MEWVYLAVGHRAHRHWPGWSAGDCRKADGGIIAQRRDGFQGHVAAALDRPLVVLFEQDRANETDDCALVREDADHFGTSFDLAVDAFERVGGVQRDAVLCREGHVGEHIRLCLIQKGGGRRRSIDSRFLGSPMFWNLFDSAAVIVRRKPEDLMGVLSWLFGGRDPAEMAQINNPATVFEKPSDVISDRSLNSSEKKKALDTWEQDARQLMTASNEGMPGREEGLDPDDHHRMADVVRAKGALGEKPKQKPSH